MTTDMKELRGIIIPIDNMLRNNVTNKELEDNLRALFTKFREHENMISPEKFQ